jgi:replicative DNA helicase
MFRSAPWTTGSGGSKAGEAETVVRPVDADAVATITELLTPEPPFDAAAVGIPTGFSDLDHLTQGLLPGALWVLIGTSGVGLTTLAVQLAGQAATTGGASAALFLGREPVSTALLNLMCSVGKVPAHHLHAGSISAEDAARLKQAREKLIGLSLRIFTPSDKEWRFENGTCSVPRFEGLASCRAGHALARVIVIDDIDTLLSEPVRGHLPVLRTWARNAGATIIVTAPEEPLLEGNRLFPDVRREADVVVRLCRDDQFDAETPRAGEADLMVLRHRLGPTAHITVAFEGHYRRFFDFRQPS